MKTKLMIAAVLAIVAPLALHAQDRWENQARGEMRRVLNFAADRGFSLTRQYYKGTLKEGQYQDLTVTLSKGRDEVLVAVCDADCRDVDIALLEADGREIAADRDDSDLAIVQVPDGHPGAHRVRVSMAHCRVAPCRFEIGLISR
jgi:hypothetical protein